MSVMLLSDKHIATLALALAHGVCKDAPSVVKETAQHLAQELKRCNVRAYNARYGEKKKCGKVSLKAAYGNASLSFARALADCWDYNSAVSAQFMVLRSLVSQHLNVEPSQGVWSI